VVVERIKGRVDGVSGKGSHTKTLRHKEEGILTGLTEFTGFGFIAPIGVRSTEETLAQVTEGEIAKAVLFCNREG
jgi:hypothetical protein